MSASLRGELGLSEADAAALCALRPDLRATLRGKRVLLAGGTGFMGKWLLASALLQNEREGAGLRLVVLSRRPDEFLRHYPGFRRPEIEFVAGDLRTMPVEGWGRLDAVVHAAADALPDAGGRDALDIARHGTERLLDVARIGGARRLLYVSSGAVYGPMTRPAREEDPLNPAGPYARAKVEAEALCLDWARCNPGCAAIVARGFAFAGPWLPLERFAFGNFLRDRVAREPIVIRGDGTDVRSYLYATDMAAWLWTMLMQGRPGGVYNLGSGSGYTLADVARLVAGGSVPVRIEGSCCSNADRKFYLPDVTRAREELGMTETVPLAEAVERSLAFYRTRR